MNAARSAHRSVTAETIAIGSELLVGGRSDSNSIFITEALGRLGIEVRFKSIVGDDQADMVQVLKTAVSRAGVVIMTGGLGPTVDDCTREAVAKATGRRLARRKAALDGMTARLAQWGRQPNKGQLRQAMIPDRCDGDCESRRFCAGVSASVERGDARVAPRCAARDGSDDDGVGHPVSGRATHPLS